MLKELISNSQLWLHLISAVSFHFLISLLLTKKLMNLVSKLMIILFFILGAFLTAAGISSKVETSNVSVGKRYARVDECGIPYAFTIDHETLDKQTVTMRDIQSMNQIRLPIADICQVINSLVAGTSKWEDCVNKYGLFN